MPRYLSICFLALCSSGLLWTVSCGNGSFEGQRPNDCIDGNDNDMDGTIDCDDEGCAGSPQCEAGDDDDDDDDDTIPTGDDDTGGNTVLVSGSVDSGIGGTGAIDNAVISEIGNESNSVTTSESGLWSLPLPRQPSTGVQGTLPGQVDSALYLNLGIGGQGPISGQTLMFLNEEELSMFGSHFGIDYDPSRGQLFVWTGSRSNKAIVDAQVVVNADHDGGFAVRGGEPRATTLIGSTYELLFLNVTPGDTEISVTTTNGAICVVPAPLPVSAGLVTSVFTSCP